MVSIVVPVYNAMPFLQEALDSICNQTFRDLQIILVDDGSTDGSLEMLRDYEKKDTRIQVLENNEEGVGAAKARNLGLTYVTGKYVLILDADDIFHLSLVEKAYETAEAHDTDIVLFDALWFDNETMEPLPDTFTINFDVIPANKVFSAKDIEDDFFASMSGPAWCQFCKHDFLKSNNAYFQELHIDDVFFSFSNLAVASRVVALPEILVRYRCNNPSSLIKKRYINPLTSVLLAGKIKEWLEERQLFEMFHHSYIKKFKYSIHLAICSIESYDGLKTLYTYLRDGGLKELGFLDYNGERELPYHCKQWIDQMSSQELGEYLFHKTKTLEKVSVYGAENVSYQFPNPLLRSTDNVILYGAGQIGSAFFKENLGKNYCNIVAWVDKNYENLGFPISGLDSFQNISYDKVLIANGDEKISQEIKKDLIALDVPQEKIIQISEL